MKSLFEGRYKITVTAKKPGSSIEAPQTEHVGFLFNRYSYDNKAKQFQLLQVSRLVGANGLENTEVINATTDEDFRPITYEYTNSVGRDTKMLSSIVAGNKMRIVTRFRGTMTTDTIELPQRIFLSEFLIFVMMRNKLGLKEYSAQSYDAIAAQDGRVYHGETSVGKAVDFAKGVKAIPVTTQFRSAKYLAYVTDTGKILKVEQSGLDGTKGLQIELVETDLDAVGSLNVPNDVLIRLFGGRFLNKKWTQTIKVNSAKDLSKSSATQNISRSEGLSSNPPANLTNLKTNSLTNKTRTKAVGGPEVPQEFEAPQKHHSPQQQQLQQSQPGRNSHE